MRDYFCRAQFLTLLLHASFCRSYRPIEVFLTAVEERPGQVQKLPTSMVAVHVETIGLQADWW